MKKIFFLILFFVCLLFSLNQVIAAEKIEVYFFEGKGCPHCAKEKPFLEKMKQKYPQLEVRDFEIYYNKDNQKLFQEVAKAYNTQPAGVPTTFIGKEFIVGFNSEDTTGNKIESLIQKCLRVYCPSPSEILAAGGIDKWQDDKQSKKQSQKEDPLKGKEISISLFGKEINFSSQSSLLFLGTILGLADGINPCMFSVLLFLLTYLLAIGSKKRAVKAGLAFAIGVFAIYFLFMLGIINLISLIGLIEKIKIVVALFALIAGLIMIKDFFAYGKWFSLEIPKSLKPLIEKLIKRGTIPSAILLALLSSLVELPCTAGIPLVYSTLLAQKSGSYIPYLIWYNIFFVLPLFVIIIGVAFVWAKVDKVEKWRLNFRKYMRLIAGLILLFLAIALFKGWL